MIVKEIKDNKKNFISLLLLADEQEDMIDRYLGRGSMYVLYDNGVKGECVVTDEGDGVIEIKNIAVVPTHHGRGYGRALVNFVEKKYKNSHRYLLVGTGDSPATVPFYEKCGFERAYTIPDFFTENYDHPIYECGVLLKDMVYFKKEL